MKITIKFFQTLAIALAISFTLLSIPGMTSPAVAFPCNEVPIQPRTSGTVSRINVADLDQSLQFYGETLGMKCISNFSGTPFWTEFYLNDENASVGLYFNPYEYFEKKNVPTLIVPDLAEACYDLKSQGIPITDNSNAGESVCMAFFEDPSGNELAYRQEKWISRVATDAQCQTILDNECALGF